MFVSSWIRGRTLWKGYESKSMTHMKDFFWFLMLIWHCSLVGESGVNLSHCILCWILSDYYNEFLFVVVFWYRRKSSFKFCYIGGGSYSTKTFVVITDNLFSLFEKISCSRNPAKGWQQPWLAILNKVMVDAQQMLHNCEILSLSVIT